MIGHLGSRVSALLDGQLSAEESERAWQHVQACHTCRDRVEREGWLKRRLAGLSFDVAASSAPADLKGALMGASLASPGEVYLDGLDGLDGMGGLALAGTSDHRRRGLGLAAIGGSAVGAAVVGVLVFGVGPADAPTLDRRAPTMSFTNTDAPRTPAPAPTTPVAHVTRGLRQQG